MWSEVGWDAGGVSPRTGSGSSAALADASTWPDEGGLDEECPDAVAVASDTVASESDEVASHQEWSAEVGSGDVKSGEVSRDEVESADMRSGEEWSGEVGLSGGGWSPSRIIRSRMSDMRPSPLIHELLVHGTCVPLLTLVWAPKVLVRVGWVGVGVFDTPVVGEWDAHVASRF